MSLTCDSELSNSLLHRDKQALFASFSSLRRFTFRVSEVSLYEDWGHESHPPAAGQPQPWTKLVTWMVEVCRTLLSKCSNLEHLRFDLLKVNRIPRWENPDASPLTLWHTGDLQALDRMITEGMFASLKTLRFNFDMNLNGAWVQEEETAGTDILGKDTRLQFLDHIFEGSGKQGVDVQTKLCWTGL